MNPQASTAHARFMTFRRGLPFALSLLTLCLGGCGTTDDKTQAQAEEEEKVSVIPWNKPQKWESKNVMSGGGGASY